MYYGVILVAVMLFGACFAMKDYYRKLRGTSGLKMSFETTFAGALGGILVLALANCLSFSEGLHFDIDGINPGFTPFTLLMATLAAANGFAFTFCSFMALGSINLSVFSLFSMLGGMVLPFLQGILFYGEDITLAKLICVLFVCVSLAVTADLKKGRAKRTGGIYYAGIFVLNGMSGVLSKIFSSSALPKTSSAGYSLWIAMISALVSGVVLFTAYRRKKPDEPPFTPWAAVVGGGSGALNKIANFLLVLALSSGVDASAQYPLVTGGVIIVSTLACYLTDRRPSRRELLSVLFAFLGTLALFLVPEIVIF